MIHSDKLVARRCKRLVCRYKGVKFLVGVGQTECLQCLLRRFYPRHVSVGKRYNAVGIAVGSGYLFPTTFEKEVTSDLVGERGILMGALCGVMEAQFYTLRANGHSPSEAFNETCEELTQSLARLVDENGMDWMYSNCSQTAQHGALKWRPIFRKAVEPVFKRLYASTKKMQEAREVIRDTGRADYKKVMAAKLQAMHDSEMWKAGEAVRALRPREKAKANAATAAGVQGRKVTK